MRGETPMLNTDVRRAISADPSKQEHLIPLAALMVHVDMDHDSEETVELAIALAERFQAAYRRCRLRAVASLHGRRCPADQHQSVRLSTGDGAFRAEGQKVLRPGPPSQADRMAQHGRIPW
jgi:hypothetical protein